jgi:hypothetical protein
LRQGLLPWDLELHSTSEALHWHFFVTHFPLQLHFLKRAHYICPSLLFKLKHLPIALLCRFNLDLISHRRVSTFTGYSRLVLAFLVNLYPHLPSAFGKCAYNPCAKTMTEKDCYAHLPTKPVIMNVYR